MKDLEMERSSTNGSVIATESPIRWAGSKRKLLRCLSQYWRDSDKKYIEAFAGSATLFFCLQPGSAVLNDANSELITALRTLVKRPKALHTAVSKIPVDSNEYYRVRALRPHPASFNAAVRFFYLNRNCFNGIYRTSKTGQFNVPFGYKTGKVPPLEQWLQSAKALKRAVLENRDFEPAVRDHVSRGDFVYLDPPYAVANRRVFKQYSPTEFGFDDILRLRSLMDYIDGVGATFVVSYALSRETGILAEGWHAYRQLIQRHVAGFSHQRKKAVEVIITNRKERIPVTKTIRQV